MSKSNTFSSISHRQLKKTFRCRRREGEITSFAREVRSLIVKRRNLLLGLFSASWKTSPTRWKERKKAEKLKLHKLDYSLWTLSFRGANSCTLFFPWWWKCLKSFPSEGFLMYLPFLQSPPQPTSQSSLLRRGTSSSSFCSFFSSPFLAATNASSWKVAS